MFTDQFFQKMAFSEISRCLTRDGFLLSSMPFLFPEYTNYDIARLTRQGLNNLCNEYKLESICCLSTGFGTTLSQLCNSFVLKHIVGLYQKNLLRQIFTGAITSLFVFPFINIIGLMINGLWHDPAYANYYFLLYKKTDIQNEKTDDYGSREKN